MICANCKSEITDTSKFCKKCGTSVIAAPETKICPSCGTVNAANAKFCKKDGYNFGAPAPVSAPRLEAAPTAPPQSATSPEVKPVDEPKIEEAGSKPGPPVSGAVTCPKCGTANVPTAKFCKNDGYPLQAAGSVTLPTAVPPPVAVPTEIPSTKPVGMDSLVKPPTPKLAPQPIPVKQSAPAAPRPAVSAAPRALVKSRKGMMIGAAVGAAILASAGGGYAYWGGYVGNRQGNVQNEINAELGSHGLSNIKVTVGKDWGASLTGSVSSQTFKDQAFGMVSMHKELKGIVDTVQIESNPADVEKNINKAMAEAGFSSVPTVQLDKDLVATLHGSANDQPEKDRMLALVKGASGVKGVKDEVEVAAPQTIPEPEPENPVLAQMAPQPSAPPPPSPAQVTPQRSIDKAALDRELNARLRANGVSGVTGHVNPDMSVALSGTVRSADERYRALTIGGSLPGANGVRETIQVVAPQVARLAPPQAPIQASPPQAAPPAPPPEAAAIDPSKLEGDINRALRSRDINSVTAQVNDDMSLTLKGSASASEKARAMQLARQVRGIHGVKDKIFVVE